MSELQQRHLYFFFSFFHLRDRSIIWHSSEDIHNLLTVMDVSNYVIYMLEDSKFLH